MIYKTRLWLIRLLAGQMVIALNIKIMDGTLVLGSHLGGRGYGLIHNVSIVRTRTRTQDSPAIFVDLTPFSSSCPATIS